MIKDQNTQQASARRQVRPGVRENVGSGLGRDREVALRVGVPGYGGAALSAVVPAETMAEIEGGDRPVDAKLKIRVPGYGWRVVGARVFPREEGSAAKSRPVRVSVPGYGGSTMRMTFAGRG